MLKVNRFKNYCCMYNTEKKQLTLGLLSSALVFGGLTFQAEAATMTDESVAVVAETAKPAEATSMFANEASQVLPSSQLLPYQLKRQWWDKVTSYNRVIGYR
ncbi:hypothetical protein [Lactiplantibacillus songbeiensis]|uniref:Uncharacterized protein n=1 Tax=Lactiplantibacillus songbeiensis TaxID=2559920 RepID=A0ABW4C3M6_9LACO